MPLGKSKILRSHAFLLRFSNLLAWARFPETSIALELVLRIELVAGRFMGEGWVAGLYCTRRPIPSIGNRLFRPLPLGRSR
jgi:hypothetical protein